ncbi:MAG: hypothetical protein DHS20C08_21550 [Rhodomicrobium sp.]|nr:MAG: hypothetical protein DHS20C08_21550 [Rhodomicrobium sp.]
MNSFTLDPALSRDTIEIMKLELCYLGLMNDKRYPWLILVPMRAEMVELIDLQPEDQQQLLTEINQVSHLLQSVFSPHKLNIATLGNMVRQLHIHIIARDQTDPAWPGPIWGIGSAQPYNKDEADSIIARLTTRLMS